MRKLGALLFCLALGVVNTCWGAVNYETATVKRDAPQGYFVFRYPLLRGETASEKAAVKVINAKLQAVGRSQAKSMQETWQSLDNAKSYKSKDVDYVVTYLDDKLLSLNFTCTFAQGEQDALYFKDGWTFDLSTGQAVTWHKLMRNEDKAKLSEDNILRLLHRGAAQNEYTLYWSLNKLDNLGKNYYVGNSGNLHVQFNPYEVGPAKSGVIDVDTGCYIKEL